VAKAVKMQESHYRNVFGVRRGSEWRVVKLSMDGILRNPSQTVSPLEPYF
jgi:hypothetical protein